VSVWEQAAGEYFKHPTRWPNPFANQVKRMDVLACEDTFIARIQMATLGFGNWAWGTFVPSPTEIFRKTLTGGYKCGFYGPLKYGSPLDLVWQDGRTSAVLGEILRPVTTGLFYLWATETLFGALQTWSTLLYKMDMCDTTGQETIMRSGHAPIGLGHNEGSPAFWHIVYDPMNRGNAFNGDVSEAGRCHYKASWFGSIQSISAQVRNVKIGWSVNGVNGIGMVDYPDIDPGGAISFESSLEGIIGAVTLQPFFSCDVPATGVLGADIFGTRVIYTIIETNEPDEPHHPQWPVDDPPQESLCPALLDYMRAQDKP